jgi:hypothetical protein
VTPFKGALKKLDEYDLRARFAPAAIVTLPVLAAAFAVFPTARTFYGIIIGPAIELVMILLLVRIARDEGKKIEPALYREWGGIRRRGSSGTGTPNI